MRTVDTIVTKQWVNFDVGIDCVKCVSLFAYCLRGCHSMKCIPFLPLRDSNPDQFDCGCHVKNMAKGWVGVYGASLNLGVGLSPTLV